jgi:trans-2,3-dihydro-3-hydroxyanthranilate isomerase
VHRTYDFVQLDVFTQTRFRGNPLAIFPNASGMSDHEMQALAKEMNLSETTFIVPRDSLTEVRDGKKKGNPRAAGAETGSNEREDGD